ncbi:protein of unknown function [Magnetospirillum sp. XM-1]|nr:protein of unknown function [Magnetospirillum sp. XM-1]
MLAGRNFGRYDAGAIFPWRETRSDLGAFNCNRTAKHCCQSRSYHSHVIPPAQAKTALWRLLASGKDLIQFSARLYP